MAGQVHGERVREGHHDLGSAHLPVPLRGVTGRHDCVALRHPRRPWSCVACACEKVAAAGS
eukprot:8823595-Pyramimonas_sp.AAC.1